MKAYITGISGFAGSFLAELLLKKGYEVHGTHVSDDVRNVEHIKHDLSLHKVNLLDFKSVENNISTVLPDVVYHLAALTSPAESFKEPDLIVTNNISAELNLLESIRLSSASPRILITSSAEVYGLISEEDLPVDENTQLRPGSPYAVSKIAQDYLGLQYNLSYGMDIVRVRPFNHIGPRQSPQFVVAAFAKQVAEIEKKHKEPMISVGNLDAKRDFTDVRDMVEAYLVLMEKGKSGDVYNVGSGKSYKISEILEKLLSLTEVKISTEVDTLKLRPSDVPDIYSDNTKINDLGWSQKFSLDKTLKDTLDYWRDVV